MIKAILISTFILFQAPTLKAQVWSSVGTGINQQVQMSIGSFYKFNDTLYIGGEFDTLGGMHIEGLGRWDGNNYSSIGSFNGGAFSITEHLGDLYCGGQIFSINGNTNIKNVAHYLGGNNWADVGGTALNNEVYCLASFQGNLYAGGRFTSTGGNNLSRVAYWDGTSWNNMGTGVNGSVTKVKCMAVYNGELYIGGEFGTANGMQANYIVKWDGANFISVGSGADAYISAMFVDTVTNRLYISGALNEINGVQLPSNVGYFDGTSWHPFGNGPNLWPISLQIYRNELYVGIPGYVIKNNNDTLFGIARWDGSDWLPLGRGCDNNVYTMVEYKNDLYVGGNFNRAGDSVAYKIARWNMPPVGVNEIKNKNEITVIYPNPSRNEITVDINYSGSKQFQWRLTEASGCIIKSGNINTSAQKSFPIDLVNIKAATYFLYFTDGEKLLKTEKIVIAK